MKLPFLDFGIISNKNIHGYQKKLFKNSSYEGGPEKVSEGGKG